MNLETLLIIGLIIIIVGLLQSHDDNIIERKSINSIATNNVQPSGSSPDKSLSTLFWGLFQNPNIFSDGWTFSEVSPNVYFKSTTLLNNRNNVRKF